MVIRRAPTVEQVPRPPVPPNFRLNAARESLAAAFQERIARDPIVQAHMEEGADWQRPLAKRIGISQATVSQLNGGNVKDVRLSTLLTLRDYLGMSLEDMLGLRPFRRDDERGPDSSHTRARSR